MEMKEEKGAITLYVTIACLFVLIIGIAGYVSISNKQTAQMEQLNEIEKSYNDERTTEDISNSYNGGDIIEINTEEEMLKIGSNEEVQRNGKTYTFSEDKTYVLKDNWENNENFSSIETKVEEAGGVIIKEYTVEKKILNAETIASDTSYYGAYVNYIPSGVTTDVKWRIFYISTSNDAFEGDTKGHIYLIADNYVEVTNLPSTSLGHKPIAATELDEEISLKKAACFSDEITGDYEGMDSITDNRLKALNSSYFSYFETNNTTSKNSLMSEVAYMMDTEIWNTNFGNSDGYSDYVVGGPTVEMLMESYSRTHNVDYQAKMIEQGQCSDGYSISTDGGVTWNDYISDSSEYLDINDSLYICDTTEENATGYRVASPSSYEPADGPSLIDVGFSGVVGGAFFDAFDGFRPVVCLNSNVQLVDAGDGTYNLKI